MCTTKGLQRVLRKRLPDINRWKSVTVYKNNDLRLPDWITPDDDTFIIYWHNPKGNNFHPYEYKEIPLSDINLIYEKNRMRLRNSTKAYK